MGAIMIREAVHAGTSSKAQSFDYICVTDGYYNATIDVRIAVNKYSDTYINLIESYLNINRINSNDQFKISLQFQTTGGANCEISFPDVVTAFDDYEEPSGGNVRWYYLRCSFVKSIKDMLETLGDTMNTSTAKIILYESNDNTTWTQEYEKTLTEYTPPASLPFSIGTTAGQTIQTERDTEENNYCWATIQYTEYVPNCNIFYATLNPDVNMKLEARWYVLAEDSAIVYAREELIKDYIISDITGEADGVRYKFTYNVRAKFLNSDLEWIQANNKVVWFIGRIAYLKRTPTTWGVTGDYEPYVGSTWNLTFLPLPTDTPIITLPTTTTYNKGNVTMTINIAIAQTNTEAQEAIEGDTATIIYTLTDTENPTIVYTGQGSWASKTETTDAEQGAMYNNVINVTFSNVAVGTYTLEVTYTHTDTEDYTESEEINIIALSMVYYGVNHSIITQLLNHPILFNIGVTTGASTGQKPAIARLLVSCQETGLTIERIVHLDIYASIWSFDLRPILPNYFNANNPNYTITTQATLYSSNYESYDTTEDTDTITIKGVVDRISLPQYYAECKTIKCIIPQFLTPLQGFNTSFWITFFDRVKIVKNGNIFYTLSTAPKGWSEILMDFTNTTEVDIFQIRNYATSAIETADKPLITTEAEKVMVKFVAPDNVAMPTFAMLLKEAQAVPTLVTTWRTFSPKKEAAPHDVVYNFNYVKNVLNLEIPNLNNLSIYYYIGLFMSQTELYITNTTRGWGRYKIVKIDSTEATAELSNGAIRIQVEKLLTTNLYNKMP